MTDITETEYRNEVEALAEDAVRSLEEYPDTYADISEVVWELVDGHEWIIHYSYNLDVLKNSIEGPTDHATYTEGKGYWRDVIQAMAYRAMENDVYFEAQDLLED